MLLELGRQGDQVEHVGGSVDFGGFGSGCSSCSRCFGAPTGPAFSIEELGVRWGRGGFVVTNNETLRLTDNPDGHRDCGEHHIIHMSNGGEPP